MTNVRALRPEEFSRLAGVEEGIVPPAGSVAVVAEHDGEIVGRMMVLFLAHLEGTWIAEGHRNGWLGRKMAEEIEQAAKERGLTQLMAYSTNGEHDAYMHRLGYERMPWTVWRKKI